MALACPLAWLLIHLDEVHTRVEAPVFSSQNGYGVVGAVLLCCLLAMPLRSMIL